MVSILDCFNCDSDDGGFTATLSSKDAGFPSHELAWILDTIDDNKGVCEDCAREIAHDEWVDNRQWQESRADHEDGVWDGEHFYPTEG